MMNVKTVARVMGGEVSSGAALVPGPGHKPQDRSLRVFVDSNAPDGFYVHSFANDDAMRCRDYVRQKMGMPAWQPNRHNGHGEHKTNGARPVRAEPHGKITATYDYLDESGALLFQVVRFEPKTFRQRQPDGRGGWIWNVQHVRHILYRLPELIEVISQERPICIVEGEKDCDNLMSLGIPATTNVMGAGKWRCEYSETLRNADVIVIGDHDDAGRGHAKTVAASLHGIAARVRMLDLAQHWPECPPKGDISDWIAAHGSAEALWTLIEAAPVYDLKEAGPFEDRKLKPFNLSEFLSLKIPAREMLLAPIIASKGLVMIYATRGTGKTHVADSIGYAVAAGTKFLKWQAPKPRRVLLVDGEMPASELQERLKTIEAAAEVKAVEGKFQIIPGDLIEAGGVGNLASPEVQKHLEPYLEGIELLILDNLSSLTAVIRDNDPESWTPIQDWLLRLRRRGISVLIVHHAGKGGQQRGTSRREDVLDTSISLRRPADYVPTEGARFEIHIEKGRGVHGADAKPFEARLEVRDGAALWTMRDIEDVNLARVAALIEDGLSIRDIADETGIKKSTVHNLKKKIEAEAGQAG
jgi:5S rRNA maturation endonuclease (ribonuclease M5)